MNGVIARRRGIERSVIAYVLVRMEGGEEKVGKTVERGE